MSELLNAIKEVSRSPGAYPQNYISDLLIQAGYELAGKDEQVEKLARHLVTMEQCYSNVIGILEDVSSKQLKDVSEISFKAINSLMAEFVLLDLPYGSKAYAEANYARTMLQEVLKTCKT